MFLGPASPVLKDALGHDWSQLDVQEAIPGAGIQCWVISELGGKCWEFFILPSQIFNKKSRLGFGCLNGKPLRPGVYAAHCAYFQGHLHEVGSRA